MLEPTANVHAAIDYFDIFLRNQVAGDQDGGALQSRARDDALLGRARRGPAERSRAGQTGNQPDAAQPGRSQHADLRGGAGQQHLDHR